jgi:excisionase family DNA binding protein
MNELMANVMTLEEAAEFLKVHPSTIYRLVKKRSLPAFKMGSDWRFNQESIERWIEDREAAYTTDKS